MLETVLESAQGGDTGAYAVKARFDWKDLAGWVESQGGEDTQGFSVRRSF